MSITFQYSILNGSAPKVNLFNSQAAVLLVQSCHALERSHPHIFQLHHQHSCETGAQDGPNLWPKKTSGKSVQRCDKRSFPNVLKSLDSQHLDHILESLLVLGPDGFFEPSSPTQRACRSDSNLRHKSLPLDSAAPLLRVMLRYWYLWPFCNLHGRSSKTTNKSGSAPLSDSACEISWQKLYALAVISILSCQAAYSFVFSFLRPMHALHDHLAGCRVQGKCIARFNSKFAYPHILPNFNMEAEKDLFHGFQNSASN